MPASLEILQQRLGHRFRRRELLLRALTHRSFAAEHNERLEFVGDSILNYTVAKMLFETFPDLPEGRLSPLRAALVRESTLADTARELDLGAVLRLGAGELKSGGRERPSILADALEAVFAAVSLDADFAAAEAVVRRLFADKVRQAERLAGGKDPKSALQERLQAQKLPPPAYRIEHQQGAGHEALFDVACDLGALGRVFRARASSRRAAEKDCAAQALAWLAARKK
ncbi:ribonuclease III [Conchiformibius kuhniae]|uniref:Ribonuclease 3 n=1 Tax=Conchiformibius kuhniae TaxID=211502 RepID=A0A8T9MTP9_9NEIS|nr:ribonuclease III [Conchiformibius kuhniae]UOP04659.1 ribonuclease III [Conchiformibius kuhniae]